MKSSHFLGFASGILALFISTVSHANPVKGPHTTLELVSEKVAFAPNETQYLGFHFKLDPEWHIYWKNPGDSGLPPRVEWSFDPSKQFEVSELLYPAPERIPYGALVNFGYSGEPMLLVKLKAKDIEPGTQVSVTAHVKWLVCKEECVPGKATLSLKVPVVSPADFAKLENNRKALFAKTIENLPVTRTPATYPQVRVVHQKQSDGSGKFTINVVPEDDRMRKEILAEKLFFFPEGEYGFGASAEQKTKFTREQLDLEIVQKEYKPVPAVRGILRAGKKSYLIEEIFDPKAAKAAAAGTTVRPDAGNGTSLGLMLLFAFIGGLILNLMPCILPVLSIKVMEIVGQGGESKKDLQKHGLVYTAGIVVSFWALAAIFLVLRSGGTQLGWGFQLQSPAFVGALTVLFMLLGLNLMGAFEIGTRFMGLGSGLASRTGYWGSFFTGVLTTIAATPCSAPFMGTALGFALTQPPFTSVLVLTTLALGLALPYLVFSFFPGASKILPRPGKWMLTFKQFLAFPLFATVIWLVTVISRQAGTDGVFDVLFAALAIYFAIWLYGHATERMIPKVSKWSLIVISVMIGIQLLFSIRKMDPTLVAGTENQKIHGVWQTFTPEKLAQELANKKTVLVNLTADWCVTCKVNESVAFENEAVKKALQTDGVIALMGDWTNGDPVITDYMARYGRNSVPVYLLYKNGASEPIMLPQILTPKVVLEALR